MLPFFAMALKTVIYLVTVSVSFLFHQEFYLIKIYGRPKFTVLGKSDL